MGTISQLGWQAEARGQEPELYIAVASAEFKEMSHISSYYVVTGELFLFNGPATDSTTLVEDGTFVVDAEEMELAVIAAGSSDDQENIEGGGYEIRVRVKPWADEVSIMGGNWNKSWAEAAK